MRVTPAMVQNFEIPRTSITSSFADCKIILSDGRIESKVMSSGTIRTLCDAIAQEKITNLSGITNFSPDYIRSERHLLCCCRPRFEVESAETVLTKIFSHQRLLVE